MGVQVSHTTRGPREGEADGVHYHFVERAEMEADIAGGRFLEHAEVHGNLYGTSAAAVRAVAAAGKRAVLDIDVQARPAVTRVPSRVQTSCVDDEGCGGLQELEVG